jgi:hypothetical protein
MIRKVVSISGPYDRGGMSSIENAALLIIAYVHENHRS